VKVFPEPVPINLKKSSPGSLRNNRRWRAISENAAGIFLLLTRVMSIRTYTSSTLVACNSKRCSCSDVEQ
jgi:hypothetical protein